MVKNLCFNQQRGIKMLDEVKPMSNAIIDSKCVADMVSVVIPVHNGKAKLPRCLETVMQSDYSNFEIVVVDDSSSDGTLEIARQYNCRAVRLEKNSGPAVARNVGVQHARGEFILFIDDDVLVQSDTISKIVSTFRKNQGIVAMVGNITESNGLKNYFSQFKNYHHRYHLSLFPRFIQFCFTTITAVKRNIFLQSNGFDAKIDTPSVEDVEFGQRLTDKGFKILHVKNLCVTHLKYYSIKSYFKNTLNRSYCYFKLFLINRGMKRMNTDKKVVYFPISTVISFLLGPLIFLIIPATLIIGDLKWMIGNVLLLLLFAYLNRGFLYYLFVNKGPYFAFRSCMVVLVDSWIISIGSSLALLDICFGAKNKWKVI
jgi:glycosyltransferase involved in cell wall biosynthesis